VPKLTREVGTVVADPSPSEYAWKVIPWGPVYPVCPVGCHPVIPVIPVGPVVPYPPHHPVCPVGPVNPVGPLKLRGPVKPVPPVGPVGPVGPVTPNGVTKKGFTCWIPTECVVVVGIVPPPALDHTIPSGLVHAPFTPDPSAAIHTYPFQPIEKQFSGNIPIAGTKANKPVGKLTIVGVPVPPISHFVPFHPTD